MHGLACGCPLPIRLVKWKDRQISTNLLFRSCPMPIRVPGLHLSQRVRPGTVGLWSPLLADARCSQQLAGFVVQNANAVPDIALLEKQLERSELIGFEIGDQPGRCSVVEREPPHGRAGWMGKTVLQTVIGNVVAPLFLDRSTIAIAVCIDLDDFSPQWIRCEQT